MLEQILQELTKIKIIDSHEHLPHEKDIATANLDFISLLTPYVCDNLLTAGMSADEWRTINNASLDFDYRYELLSRYLGDIQFTTYFKAIKESVKACFGIDDLSLNSIHAINGMLKKEKSLGNLFKSNNIEKGMTFIDFYGVEYFDDSEFLIPVPTVSYLTPKTQDDIKKLKDKIGVKIESLKDLSIAIEKQFEVYSKHNIRNIKIGSAYNRKLDYSEINYIKAEEQLQKVINNEIEYTTTYGDFNINLPLEQLKELDDFVIEKCICLAEDNNMTVIFHTGIHAWNKNNVEACRAKYLFNVIMRHPKANFALLHFSYPYVDDALLLCKYFKNVYLDFAWVHILDSVVAIKTIKRVIELLPTNKIVAFGGDVCTPFNTIGNLKMSFKNYAIAFSEMINDNLMTKDDAMSILKKWFYDNPKRIYQL